MGRVREQSVIMDSRFRKLFSPQAMMYNYRYVFFLKEFIYFRVRGREEALIGCLSHAPKWGPGLQHRHVS